MNLSDVLNKIEPYLTQEELTLVGQMEADIGELEAEITELRNAIRRLENKNQNLREKVEDLEEELSDVGDDVESLKLFRDPSNWDGNKFIPVLHYQRGDDPWNL